jgi:hypothetical protein
VGNLDSYSSIGGEAIAVALLITIGIVVWKFAPIVHDAVTIMRNHLHDINDTLNKFNETLVDIGRELRILRKLQEGRDDDAQL